MRARATVLAVLLFAACGEPSAREDNWQLVARDLPSALFSVWGTSARDVYIVGADARDGQGPAVHHFDGASWTRLSTGQIGNLWWVYGFAGGPIFMGGDGGMILRYQDGAFTRMTTPGVNTVFGIWGSSPEDMWAVGGADGGANGAFAWRLQGETWVDAPGFPAGLATTDAIWKIHGRGANDAWMVGTNGKVVQWDGRSLTESRIAGESLFTAHADRERFVAVGGFGTGKILENEGAEWRDASPPGAPSFIGVCLSPKGDFVVGRDGAVFSRGSAGWRAEDTGFPIDQAYHSVWVDPSGGVWAVGGQVLIPPYVDGVVLHRGTQVPEGLR